MGTPAADDEVPFPEPFGPVYERPQGAPCPDCRCCTDRLCRKAVSTGLSCLIYADVGDREIVAGCPCSPLNSTRTIPSPPSEDQPLEP